MGGKIEKAKMKKYIHIRGYCMHEAKAGQKKPHTQTRLAKTHGSPFLTHRVSMV